MFLASFHDQPVTIIPVELSFTREMDSLNNNKVNPLFDQQRTKNIVVLLLCTVSYAENIVKQSSFLL